MGDAVKLKLKRFVMGNTVTDEQVELGGYSLYDAVTSHLHLHPPWQEGGACLDNHVIANVYRKNLSDQSPVTPSLRGADLYRMVHPPILESGYTQYAAKQEWGRYEVTS